MSAHAAMIDAYLAGVAQLREGIRGMSPQQVMARPVAGKWSTLECVSHIADFEPVFADRIKRILAIDKPLLMAADENDYFKNLVYEHRDLDEELALIEATRKELGRILRHVPESSLQRAGVHSEKGLITAADLLGYVTNHLTHHLRHILDKKNALGIG